MIEQSTRPARKVGIADHLWETYEEMAHQMGSDRDALINQALFMFARLNGFIEVARGGRVEAPAVVAAAPAHTPAPVAAAAPSPRAVAAAPAASGTPRPAAPPVLAAAPAPKAAPPVLRDEPPPALAARERPSANALDDDPVRREVAERVLETAAELERLIKGKNEAPPPEEIDELPEEDDQLPEAEDPSADLNDMLPEDEPPPEEEPADEDMAAADEEGAALFLVTEAGDQEQIVKERFIIGRGKHCDFVINSGKVSREHAVITHEGPDWFIEDLGSSNGTWYNKQRIKRRKIESGDEYFICSEKVKLVLG
jgi:type IV secretory pathway VirB10-like protein